MEESNELKIEEIRNFMLENGGKITNTALVKQFRRFLTGSKDSSRTDSTTC